MIAYIDSDNLLNVISETDREDEELKKMVRGQTRQTRIH